MSEPQKRKATGKAKKASGPDYAPFFSATVTPSDLMTRYRGNPAVRNLVDSCKGWAAICCHLRAEQGASFPIRLYGRSDKSKGKRVVGKTLADLRSYQNVGRKSAQYAESAGANVVEITDHPALNVLHKPSPFQSGQEFFYFTYLMESACGNAFYEVVETKDKTSPYQLLPMLPQDVSLEINNDENIPSLVAKYTYGRGPSRSEYEYDRVIHFKRAPSMFSPYWGTSPLQSVLPAADLLEMATLQELARAEGVLPPNLTYEFPAGVEPTEVQVKQVEAQMRARHQGPDKAGSIFIGVGKLSTLDQTNREMQYRDGQVYYSQMILAAYRVPESKVRLNDANLGSARTADIEFLSEAIRPMLVKMAETLTEEILYKRMGLERGSVWFAYDDIVPRDIQGIQAAVVGNVQNQIWTPDEGRAELGYGPLPDGEGAKLRAPAPGLGMGTPAAPVIDGQKVPQAPQGPTADGAAPLANGEIPPADTALNGAQIQQLFAALQGISAGLVPIEAARVALRNSFPMIPASEIDAMLAPLVNFKPAAPVASAPGSVADAEDASEPPEKPGEKPDPEDKAEAPEPQGKSRVAVTVTPLDGSWTAEYTFSPSPAVSHWETVRGPEGKSLLNQKRTGDGLLVMGGRVIRALDESGKSVTSEALSSLADQIAAWYRNAPASGGDLESRAAELDSIIGPQLERIFQAGGVEGLSTLASMAGGADLIASTNASFSVIPEEALKFLKSYTVRLARQITETQHADLTGSIAEAMKAGVSQSEATKLVQEALPEVASWKAEQISRTESARAYTAGNIAAWNEAGVKEKQWLLAPDACPMCRALAAKFNKPQPIGEPFAKVGDSFTDETGTAHQIGYSDVDGPPLHPHDRCAVLPVI